MLKYLQIKILGGMTKYLTTEEAVKKALNIDSFRNISKDKIMDFIFLIPSMDKDIALAAINQFPNYVEMTTSMVKGLISLCDYALKSSEGTHKESIDAYKQILNIINDDLKREDIPEERENHYKRMIEVADKIANKDTEYKELVKFIIKCSGKLLAGTLIAGVCILGINVKGVNKI